MRVAQPSSEIPPTNQRWKDRPKGSSMHFERGRDWGCRPTPNGSSRQSAFQCEADESYWKREESRVFGDAKAAGSAIQSYDLPVKISGTDVPDAIESFDSELIHPEVRDNILKAKYTHVTPVQMHSIPIVCRGRDLMSCAQTGSGKTAAFLIPIISRLLSSKQSFTEPDRRSSPSALILSPTRELTAQIHKEALKFTFKTVCRPVVVYGGANMRDQVSELRRGCNLLIATPGRLVDLMEQGYLSLANIQFLCLDEADRMLDMGFEPQIRRIVEQADMPIEGRQTLMFSATFSKIIQRLASDFLYDHVFITVGQTSSTAKNITQRIELVEDERERDSLLLDLLGSIPGRTIIFVETKRKADEIEYWISNEGFAATSIHGDRDQREREAAIRSFKSGQTPYLVATDVAARGLDISDVMHVINFQLPKDMDSYVHRIGRTGRAGNTGLATSFMSYKDKRMARDLRELLSESHQSIPDWLESMALQTSFGGRGSIRESNRFGATDVRTQSHAKTQQDPTVLYQARFAPLAAGVSSLESKASSYWDD